MRFVLLLCVSIALAGCGEGSSFGSAGNAPQPCLDAIADARDLADSLSAVLGEASEYGPWIKEAAMAGASDDIATIESIGRRLNRSSEKLDGYIVKVERQVESFNANAAKCE